jgi:outer membrane protein OmpA-like peptidoglycan-associated protein
MGVPIETVVGLLQDSKGRIELGIPISGDLRSPEFDLSQTIGRAVSGAITAAVTAPFQLLYQPVALVAGAIGGSGVALKPVVFAPGEAKLDATGAAFANALAKMLQERPRLTLQVCGRATAADLEAALAAAANAADRKAATDKARPALQALATDRGRAVRQYLADKGGIRADRIGECRASFNPGDQGPPRAEFSF